jgi:hypothetical protein
LQDLIIMLQYVMDSKQSFTTLNNRIYWHYAKLKN